MAATIALVTGAEMAKPDPETHLLVAALRKLGIATEIVPWQADADWAAYSLVLIRTPWDYFRHLDAFLAWAERVARLNILYNPVSVLHWNGHKGYLRDLAAAGVATVPTLWFDLGHPDPEVQLSATGWDKVVVKPAVSIGAIGAALTHVADQDCLRHLNNLLVDGDAMVQPYIDSIADWGEVSLVYFAGTHSHAIRKQPKAGDFRVQDMYGGTVSRHTPDADELSLACAALACTPEPTLYARVDLVRYQGKPVVIELELIEPELFLPFAEGGGLRLAEAIQSLLEAKNAESQQR